ncbi:MAG: DUF357 domain-containing protein [Candidatus Altiarchaeales archaeon]|nr:DUF357 domain-containing protein [Candidatus Altiarchaeales archaeon]
MTGRRSSHPDLEEKLKKYLDKARPRFTSVEKTEDSLKADKLISSALNYFSDANHFFEEGNYVNALAALEYAEGWLDAGCELGFLEIKA